MSVIRDGIRQCEFTHRDQMSHGSSERNGCVNAYGVQPLNF